MCTIGSMNSLDKAIKLCGGPSALAGKIGISSARLGNWRVRGVPVESWFLIEAATDGEVTRKDLRPDDWQKIWPELATPSNTTPASAAVRERNPETNA
jgi:DNA-binding transcriptional regulator YdaS (Cro superfamily)